MLLEIFDSMCILLAKSEQKHFSYTKKLLDQSGLEISPGQLVVLYSLFNKDNISISELSKNVLLDNSTLTGLIDRLEKAGLVLRIDTPNDRRSYQIILTEKAKNHKPTILKVMKEIESKMLEGCSEAEIFMLRSILQRILTNFNV
jgi:DNA-binding MarR family transcriptional regulator